ncbi:MAG TPA: glycoside hydrolase family 31 protein [Casimicrobiaceae bacterium]|nr:glycoside hydrolase family 31 protein [Casimicrobiaceae bacterium]
MKSLGRATFGGVDDTFARFDFDAGWHARVYLLRDDVARVLLLRNGMPKEPRTWMVTTDGNDVPWQGRDRLDVSGFERPTFDVERANGAVALVGKRLRIEIGLDPFTLAWSIDGERFAQDRATYSYAWSERDALVHHFMARDVGDQYFGLGDKTGPLDKHGRRLRTLALDALGYSAETSDPLYKHWPFFIVRNAESGLASGFFYDSLAPMTFDLGCEFDNYHGFYRRTEIDDGDLDYYVIAGPAIRDVVQKFSVLTGRTELGPRWSLGYANTAMSLADAPDAQAQLARFVSDAQRHDIPLSAFHFGSGYTSIGKRRYVFTWNRDKFPEPRAAIRTFNDAGARTVVNLKPCLLDDHPNYAEVAARDAFVNDAKTGAPCIGQFWDGQGAQIDFTNPVGIRWWQDSLARQVLEYGIDAGWNDNNEYEIWDDDGISHGFGTPIPIHRSRPLHALLMTRATAEAQAAHHPGQRVFTVTRAGPPGIQRYAQTWSGDNTTSWHTLRWNLRMGLTMSLSGMFNTGHDIGGFAGPVPDAELLVRWVQNGVFSPRFMMNSWKTGGETNSPWLHEEAIVPIRDAIRLRYRLLPYFYTLAARASRFADPWLRPTFYDFEADPRTFDDCDDFMCGAQLLVASVVAPDSRLREVYLPAGPSCWFALDTGARYAPASVVQVDAPLERIPVFCPAGAMVPMTDSDDFSRLTDEPSRSLRVFPAPGDATSEFTLYEDDGATLGYRDGDYAEVAFEMTTTKQEIRIRARVTGRYALPFDTVRIVVATGDARPLRLEGAGVELRPAP